MARPSGGTAELSEGGCLTGRERYLIRAAGAVATGPPGALRGTCGPLVSPRTAPFALPVARVSGEDVLHHDSVHVGETEVAALVGIGEPQVVDAQQVQDRGVEIVHVHLLMRR